MKTATYYRSEFVVVGCPYCSHKQYLDTEDMAGDIGGKVMKCESCSEWFRIVIDY